MRCDHLNTSDGPKVTGVVTVIGTDSLTGAELSRIVSKNMVMDGSFTGLDLIIQWIIGQMAIGQGAAAYQNGINYGEIGTGNTAPALTDTGLIAGVARTVPTLQQDFGLTQAILQFFFPDATIANATYTEFGTFVNGTATLGTGNIFNRVLFNTPYVKTSGIDTTIQVTFTMSQ
jgi:hypothetical protein